MISAGVEILAGPYTAAGETVFSFGFPCTGKNNLSVVTAVSGVETTQEVDNDFTVYLNPDQNSAPGGTVTFLVAPANGTLVTVRSNVRIKQSLDLTQGGAFNPDTIEQALDDVVLMVGQVQEQVDRALTLDVTSTADVSTLQDALLSVGPSAAAAAADAERAETAAGVIDGFENKLLYAKNTQYYKNNLIVGVDAVTPDSERNGTTYIALKDFVSTNGASDSASLVTDLADVTRLQVFAKRGASGSGSGDVSASNYLSEYAANKPLARTNLGLGTAAVAATGTGTGDVPLNSDILGKHTIWVPAGAMASRTTQGAGAGSTELATHKVMVKTLDFSPITQVEYAQFEVRMPKSWDESTIQAIFVWSHPTASTPFNVVWGIHGRAYSNDDALDAAFGTGIETQDTGGTADDLYQSPAVSLTGTHIAGTAASEDVVRFQVYRKFDSTSPVDDLAVDARLHGVVLLYNVNTHKDD